MKKQMMNTAILFLSLALVACACNTRKENTGFGAGTGAAVGAMTGNPFAIAGGAVLGGIIGYHAQSQSDHH